MKRVLFLTIVFVMLFSFPVLANEDNMNGDEETKKVEEYIEPRYTYIGFISIDLSIDESGCVDYNCSARAPYRNVRLKLYLQRSRNQVIWENIIGTIKTEYDSGKISETYNLPADDYFYRAKVVVEVLDENKNIIESETAYSDSQRY